jgi:hypothetical protein
VVSFYSQHVALAAKPNFSWTYLLRLCKKRSQFADKLILWKNVSPQSSEAQLQDRKQLLPDERAESRLLGENAFPSY